MLAGSLAFQMDWLVPKLKFVLVIVHQPDHDLNWSLCLSMFTIRRSLFLYCHDIHLLLVHGAAFSFRFLFSIAISLLYFDSPVSILTWVCTENLDCEDLHAITKF